FHQDAPSVTVPSGLTTTEETATALGGLSVSDLDSTTLTLDLSVDAAQGTLTFDGSTGTTFTRSGTAAELNALLSGLIFTPARNFSGQAAISLSVSDGSLTDAVTVPVTVTEQTDAPVLTLPTGLSIAENTPLTISQIQVADPDSALLTLRL